MTTPALASFEENARRYLSAQEIVDSLDMFFSVHSYSGCNYVDTFNASLLGVNSALSGNPISAAPNQSTVQWISGCIAKASTDITTGMNDTPEQLKLLAGPEVYAYLISQSVQGEIYSDRSNSIRHFDSKWNSWPAEIQAKLISNMVFVMLGSDDVIRDFGLIEPDALRAKLAAWPQSKPDLTARQMFTFLSVNLALRDEFLSY
jgi:hypothetical protein